MLKLSFACLLAVVACSASPQPAKPQAPAPAPVAKPDVPAQLTSYIESIGRGWNDSYKFSGYVLVAQGDTVLFERGYGYANLTTRARNTAETSFRIGSTTKQFTATAILLLESEGKLSVGDPIAKHLPDYPKTGRSITIHQLLTHTSGIPSFTSMPEYNAARSRPHTVDQLLALFANKPLDFAPGTKWDYSNSNYIVLGAIIERVAKQPYAAFLRERIFKPAGLTRTVVGDASELSDRAIGYQPDGDRLVEAPPIDMSVPFAAGAVRSTARDLWRWHRTLGSDAVLPRRARDKLYQVDKRDYAYGWFVHDRDGRRVIEHGGDIDGFSTAYMRELDTDLVVVVWTNNMRVRPDRIAKAALDLVHGKQVKPIEAPPKPSELDPQLARRAAGHYKLTAAGRKMLLDKGLPADALAAIETVEVIAKPHSLGFKPSGQPAIDLAAVEGGKFVAPEFGVTVEFERDRLRVTQRGLTIEYAR